MHQLHSSPQGAHNVRPTIEQLTTNEVQLQQIWSQLMYADLCGA